MLIGHPSGRKTRSEVKPTSLISETFVFPTFYSKMWETQRSTSGFVYKIFNGFTFVYNQIVFPLQLNKPVVGEPACVAAAKQIGWKKFQISFVEKNLLLTDGAVSHLERSKCQLFVFQLDTVHLLGISTPSEVTEISPPSRVLRNDIFSFMISLSHLIFYSFRVTAKGIFQAFFFLFKKAYILLSLLNHKIVSSGECTP